MQHSAPNLSNLTALRGITALLVAVYHFEGLLARFVPVTSSLFFSKSYLMVDIFFIMSGFIITHVYQDSFRAELGVGKLRNFIVARFARIYPMHLIALLIILVSFLASGAKPDPIQDPQAIVSNLLLVHSFGIHDIYTWNVPSWSISAEWWCYMLFPFLMIFIDRWKVFAVTLLLILTTLAYLGMMYWLPRWGPLYPAGSIVPQDLNVTFDYGFLRGLSGFVVGMMLYKLYENPSAKAVFGADWIFLVFTAATVSGLHFGVPDIICIPLFAGLVMTAACNKGTVHKVFQWRPLQFIGDVSYSVYMLHVIVIFTILEILRAFGITTLGQSDNLVAFWPGLLGCAAFLLIVVGLSSVSYAKLEKPCRDYINRKAMTKSSR